MISYSTFNDRSPIGDILDMVARHAPRLMKSGGGALTTELKHNDYARSGRRISDERRALVVSLLRQGHLVEHIYRQTGTARKTIRAICVAEGLAMPDGRAKKAEGTS